MQDKKKRDRERKEGLSRFAGGVKGFKEISPRTCTSFLCRAAQHGEVVLK